MKTIALVFLQLLCAQWLYAQKFQFQFSQHLPDTVSLHAVEWADADNDGVLDVIAMGKNSNDETVCFFFRKDRLQALAFAGSINTQVKDAAWLITDIDGDNSVDVMISGSSSEGSFTSGFLNIGDFAFERTVLSTSRATTMAMADLNQDGGREMLISGYRDNKPYLTILERRSGEWIAVHDSINICASSVETLDFDADSDVDFFVTGTGLSGAKVSRVYYNERAYHFSFEEVLPAVTGASVKADLSHDGRFDVLVAGEDDTEPRLIAFMNDRAGNFSAHDTLHPVADATVFAGDLNSDGLCDVNVFGFEENGDTLNVITSAAEASLGHKDLLLQSWGDGDRDGDLDLLQVIKTKGGYSLQVIQNTTLPQNAEPAAPSGLVIAEIMNRLLVCWEKPTDDRTPQGSLTYDVSIQSADRNVMSADFDVLNGRRLNVSHGNNGTADYLLLRNVGAADIGVNIQAVDNSFHAGPGSICKASGIGESALCGEVETMWLDRCRNETVTLSGSPNTRWYSFTRGFLADTSALVFDFHQPDTVFSLTRHPDCTRIAVYVLGFGNSATRITESKEHVCEGEAVHFGVEPGWKSVEWTSVSRGFLSSADTITYIASEMDTVKVMLSNGEGCFVQHNTVISASKPAISGDDTYQILKGESARLSVSGGTSYEWFPVTGLDDATSPHPLASPLKTTEYTVTASDSSGCRSSMRIVVLVEETAFIPNLFTPNRDGKNDDLKIYGLGQVTDFSFTIFNREGSRVYHTRDVANAVNQGWNGTTEGVDQPGGVYYWNVSGQTAGGKELKLNGRKSGAIVLLRWSL